MRSVIPLLLSQLVYGHFPCSTDANLGKHSWKISSKRKIKGTAAQILRFDTSVNILCNQEAGKTTESFVVCCSELVNLQNHAFTPDSDGCFALTREHRSTDPVSASYSTSILLMPWPTTSLHTPRRRIVHGMQRNRWT